MVIDSTIANPTTIDELVDKMIDFWGEEAFVAWEQSDVNLRHELHMYSLLHWRADQLTSMASPSNPAKFWGLRNAEVVGEDGLGCLWHGAAPQDRIVLRANPMRWERV